MALTYTWTLSSLRKTDAQGLEGIVVGTQWVCTGIDDDGYSGSFVGATPFNLDEVDPENFTPYEELTKDQVLGWIESTVMATSKNHIDEQILKQIEAQKNPIVEVNSQSFPWAEPDAPSAEPTN